MRGLCVSKTGEDLVLHSIRFHRSAHDRLLAVYRSCLQPVEFFFEHLLSYDECVLVDTRRLFKRASGGAAVSEWMLSTQTFDTDCRHVVVGLSTGECMLVDLTREDNAPRRMQFKDDVDDHTGVGHIGVRGLPLIVCPDGAEKKCVLTLEKQSVVVVDIFDGNLTCVKHEFNFGLLAHYERAAQCLSHTGLFFHAAARKQKLSLSLPLRRTLYCRDATVLNDRYAAVMMERVFDMHFVAIWDVLDLESGPLHAFAIRKQRIPIAGSMSGGGGELLAFCVNGRKFVRLLVYHVFRGVCLLSLSLAATAERQQEVTTAISPGGKWVAVCIDGTRVLVGAIDEIRKELLLDRSFRMRPVDLGEERQVQDFCFLADRCLQIVFFSVSSGRTRVVQITL